MICEHNHWRLTEVALCKRRIMRQLGSDLQLQFRVSLSCERDETVRRIFNMRNVGPRRMHSHSNMNMANKLLL